MSGSPGRGSLRNQQTPAPVMPSRNPMRLRPNAKPRGRARAECGGRRESLRASPRRSDCLAHHRTQSVPTMGTGRDKVGTLEARHSAVSRLSRVSRHEKHRSKGGRRAPTQARPEPRRAGIGGSRETFIHCPASGHGTDHGTTPLPAARGWRLRAAQPPASGRPREDPSTAGNRTRHNRSRFATPSPVMRPSYPRAGTPGRTRPARRLSHHRQARTRSGIPAGNSTDPQPLHSARTVHPSGTRPASISLDHARARA